MSSFLVIVHPYPPTPSSGAHRWGAIVKYLRRMGHDVRVVTSGAFGTLADPAQERDVIRTADLMASPRLRRLVGIAPLAAPDGSASVAGPDPGLPGLLTKTLVPDAFLASWAPMALAAARRSLRERPADCVITSSPNESTHLIGLALRRLGHAWIADLRDGWTFERFLPEFPTRPQRSLNRALERRALTGADSVMAATEPIAADLRARLGIDVAYVPNAWDPDLDAGIGAPDPPGGHDLELVHTGKLSGGWGRDPRPLLKGVRRLLDERPGSVRLRLAGRVDEEDSRLIAEAGLGDAVEHVGQLGRAEAVRLQRGAGVLLLVTSRHSGEATGKLFEYLAAGRPILAVGGINEAARIVGETGTGVAVDSHDEEAVLAALRAAASGQLPYAPHGLERYRHPSPAERVIELADVAQARHGR